jgi:rare lipoprotein A
MHARKNRIRWVLSLGALAIALIGAIPAAQAATGGASSYTAPAPPTASDAEAEGVAFSTPLRYAGASWYGPGLYGRHTACGQTLRATTVGVAHKTLPCGTLVKFVFHGRSVVAPVIDRGPYVKGRAWDLTTAASKALGFEAVGVGRVAYAVEMAAAKQ